MLLLSLLCLLRAAVWQDTRARAHTQLIKCTEATERIVAERQAVTGGRCSNVCETCCNASVRVCCSAAAEMKTQHGGLTDCTHAHTHTHGPTAPLRPHTHQQPLTPPAPHTHARTRCAQLKGLSTQTCSDVHTQTHTCAAERWRV